MAFRLRLVVELIRAETHFSCGVFIWKSEVMSFACLDTWASMWTSDQCLDVILSNQSVHFRLIIAEHCDSDHKEIIFGSLFFRPFCLLSPADILSTKHH